MAIDTADRKVYWLDPFEYALHRIGYDGDDNEVISQLWRLATYHTLIRGLFDMSDILIWFTYLFNTQHKVGIREKHNLSTHPTIRVSRK